MSLTSLSAPSLSIWAPVSSVATRVQCLVFTVWTHVCFGLTSVTSDGSSLHSRGPWGRSLCSRAHSQAVRGAAP